MYVLLLDRWFGFMTLYQLHMLYSVEWSDNYD
jgi:hypothetical protein